MVLLGFYLGHDSNIAVSIDGKIKYRKSERFYQDKHLKSNISFVHQTLKDWNISKVDFCAYTDGNRNNLGECSESELFCPVKIFNFPSICLDHHYAHALSAWPILESDNVHYAVIEDGKGDRYRSGTIIKNPFSSNPTIEDVTQGLSMGYEFYLLGKMLGFSGLEYDFAGKVMGLTSYKDEELKKFNIKKLTEYNYKDYLIYSLNGKYKNYYEWHEYWWQHLLNKFKYIDKNSNIIYSGGCAQNSVFNYRLKKIYPNIKIPPHCYDGGLSLGCLEYLRIKLNLPLFDKSNFPFWQDDLIEQEPDRTTIEKTARLLAKNKIIGWTQNRGELGPRALGNRSILMNANIVNGKDILNKYIKKREPWRPYAGSVLEEYSNDYFDLNKSEYMLYACNVHNKNIKSITHVDNTCRMQTVSKGYFYELIKEYGNLTGDYILCNTSLNLAGKPLVSKINNPIHIMNECNLNNLVVGNKIYNNLWL